jgi:hypothetical protein
MPAPRSLDAVPVGYLDATPLRHADTAEPAVMLWLDYGGVTHRPALTVDDARRLRADVAKALDALDEPTD